MTNPRSRSRFATVCSALALALVAAVFMAAPAQAQSLYGSITGTVTDQQKAALPGVAVTATNSGTGLKLEAVTDERGTFTFRNLMPGTYDLTASLTGFKELRRTGQAVAAGNALRVDLTLDIGGVTETINVTAETTLIKTEKADLSTEITSKQLTNLPLNQFRNYQTLLNLVPGATPTALQNAELDSPGRSLRTFVNGTQPNSNTTRVDGAVSVNIWLPHHAGYVQPAESIDTVAVATNSFDADTGMAAGAAQTVITKSGTNELKGSAFLFYNNQDFNANTFYNNAYGLKKTPTATHTYGGTLGGPIVKNKLFYFASWEQYRRRQTTTVNYSVPTAKMRNGDFSEVLSVYPNFKLFDPETSPVTGVGRTQFANYQIPANRISSIAKAINSRFFPAVNSSKDLNSNGFLDDYAQDRTVEVDRGNYDFKFTYQRNAAHSIWAKFSTLKADVVDNFYLGFDNGSTGDTNVYVGAVGHTWTLTPTLVLDGNVGYNRQDQKAFGPDYGTNYGLELGIGGVNDANDIRASGMPQINAGYATGQTPSWMPLFRKEITYSFSSALTKVFPKHEVRLGVDVVKMELNHRQAEFGDYGLKGGFSFSGNITGAPGYTALTWNQYAAFLLGRASYYSKDTQTEDMVGREWQSAIYIRDRWHVNSKLTLNAGVRLEYYPLMTRGSHGIELLDYNTYMVTIGGLGGKPTNPGINLKEWYLAPRVGASYRLNDKTGIRAAYGRTINPLPWSRPMRGSFPYDIAFNATADTYATVTTLNAGIPTVVIPDYSSGSVKLPAGVYMRSPNPNDVDRGVIQQWNVAFERRLPGDISIEAAYVGTRTDGGYADRNLNYGEPGGGNASRHYYQSAGTTAINDWASRTKSRYHGLQVAINRPFKNGLMLKGAYTLAKAKNETDEDGWTSLSWNHDMVYDKNYGTAGYDRRHVFQMGFVYELPFLKNNTDLVGKVLGGWQINGVFAYYTGTPFSISGTNNALNCPACGSVLINVSGDPTPSGTAGSMTEKWYDVSAFSQPTGLTAAGFGNSEKNQFRRPSIWNLDMSLFKGFQIGRVRPELRIEAANVLNHTNWGAPNTTFTSAQFMMFNPGSTSQSSAVSGDVPGARRVQVGVRVGF